MRDTWIQIRNDGKQTNETVFWNTYAGIYGEEARADEPRFAEFYGKRFGELSGLCGKDPAAGPLVHDLRAAGYTLAAATNPLFPMTAQHFRLGWAGTDRNDFSWITSYENSSFCKPSAGYYFVQLDGRNWVGPYEAVKRYRRLVDSSLADVTKFTILGKIVDITAEIPAAGENKTGRFEMGWVVEPVAVQVPGHVVAVYDANAESSGKFIGEDEVAKIKDSWYTVKSIPQNVTPDKLMEIFMMAIKEKNFDLYLDCISPDRKMTPTAISLIKYHWDLHQGRFLHEYIHATFGKPKIYTTGGFDESNDQENFFLDDQQKDVLRKTQGESVQRAEVESRAYDQNGKQLGSPHPHYLIKKGAGRWYVDDYTTRF